MLFPSFFLQLLDELCGMPGTLCVFVCRRYLLALWVDELMNE